MLSKSECKKDPLSSGDVIMHDDLMVVATSKTLKHDAIKEIKSNKSFY